VLFQATTHTLSTEGYFFQLRGSKGTGERGTAYQRDQFYTHTLAPNYNSIIGNIRKVNNEEAGKGGGATDFYEIQVNTFKTRKHQRKSLYKMAFFGEDGLQRQLKQAQRDLSAKGK
jgi:hypothetical protein